MATPGYTTRHTRGACKSLVRSRESSEESNEGEQTAEEGLFVSGGKSATLIEAAGGDASLDEWLRHDQSAVSLSVVSEDVVVAHGLLADAQALDVNAAEELLNTGSAEEGVDGSAGE